MRRDFRLQKRLIIAAIILLLAADVALAAYSWNLGSSRNLSDLVTQTTQLKISQGDVTRAKEIQASMPTIQADCDKFEHMLFPASTGYSSVTADLDGIAQKAGALVQDLGFKETEVPQRGLTSVEITSTISGNYSSIVRFVNGLQRSSNVYILDALMLGSDSTSTGAASQIRVTLHLNTYFRTGA
jgi:Tfp pilus assembly protein PilO